MAIKSKGFTLVELLLLMVILAVFLTVGTGYMQQKTEAIRIDKTVLQIQYILNAGLAYYIANGRWPNQGSQVYLSSGTASELQPDYLPGVAIPTQFGGPDPNYYHRSSNAVAWGIPANTFAVMAYIGTSDKQKTIGNMIASKLGSAFFDGSPGYGYVFAYVYPPGQNRSNATGMNFAGLYHHGACVPVPVCPKDANGVAMTAQVYIVPISASGVNDDGLSNVYPLSSFSAYATGGTSASPPPCANATITPACAGGNLNGIYWRACMQVVTSKGDVSATRTDNWGNSVTMAAFTRCSITSEPAGSGFGIYGN